MASGSRGRKTKKGKSPPSSKAEGAVASRAGRPKGTGTQRVYAQVREDIIGLRLPPGSDLDEAGLEQRFGVSRTPVREALIRLASDGLIILLPNRGARVTQIDISELPQLFEALELCQRATIRWAAVRHTADHIRDMRERNRRFLDAARQGDMEGMGEANHAFHIVIARACGNRYFESLYVSLLAVSLRLARTCFAYAPMTGDPVQDYYLEVVRQHDEMVNAIERCDPDEAETLARVHTDLFRERIMRYIGSNLAGGVSLQALG